MKNQTEYVKHTFAPVYDSSSRVLLLGTMPSPKSREEGLSLIHIWTAAHVYYIAGGVPADAVWKGIRSGIFCGCVVCGCDFPDESV